MPSSRRIPRRPRWPSPCIYAALLLHTYTAFPFFEDSATQREGERGPRGAKFAHTWTHTHARRPAERGETPKAREPAAHQKPRDNESPSGARRRWPAGISRLPFILRESEGERERNTELQATPSSSQLCWPLASHRQLRTFAIVVSQAAGQTTRPARPLRPATATATTPAASRHASGDA